jgi:hypothetical protein
MKWERKMDWSSSLHPFHMALPSSRERNELRSFFKSHPFFFLSQTEQRKNVLATVSPPSNLLLAAAFSLHRQWHHMREGWTK